MGVETAVELVDVDVTLEEDTLEENLEPLEVEAFELVDVVELRNVAEVRIRLDVVVVDVRVVDVDVRTDTGANVGCLKAGVAMSGSSRSPWSPSSTECSSHSLSSSSLPVTAAWTTSRYTASRIKASSSMIQSSPGTKKCAVTEGSGGHYNQQLREHPCG